MIAKTFQGLEEVLAEELTSIGASNVQIQRRAVSFTGNKALMYKTNLHCRTALRILKPIFTFDANDADEVYEQIKKFEWSQLMTVENTFAIDATVFSEEFTHSKYVVYRVKDAIADWFMERYHRRPSVSVTSPQLMFNIHIAGRHCTLSLDSSGESLHKRGYRVAQTEAPINEVLAAGMLLLAGWHGQSDFLDPMCGSGTLLIEAALIALNMPPGIFRPSFAFEKWSDFDKELFDELYNDDSQEKTFEHKIYGSDISARAIKIAEQNVKSSGLSKYIQLKIAPLEKLEPPSSHCFIVTNPPYGERLPSKDIFDLYASLGSILKHKFSGNTAWIISSNEEALKKIGLKPSKRFQLLNGPLECWFQQYELFAGKRNEYLQKKNA
ncbi:MAG: RNA methyltransferase [Paludibacteraceae bacterium]|nr:RNA methyltransferase [Paludibacteraceae bacterium]